MNRSLRNPLALAAGALLALAACSKPPPAAAGQAGPARHRRRKDAAREKEVLEAAVDAYVYGYPLVTMELTRRVMTNVAKPTLGKLAPMGQLARLRAYPTPADRAVTAPNADTLYTLAWLDVGAEPWIVTIPDMKGRYFLLPLLSGWTDVFEAPGSRTTGTRAQKYAITGPGWKGKLPAGVKELRSPTALVWMLGRISSSGTPQDLAEVHALQDRMAVVPLSAWGKKKYVAPAGKPDPAVDMETPVRDQVNGLDAVAYFKLLASLLKANPPAAADTAAVAALARIGLVPGQDYDGGQLDSVSLKALAGAPRAAQARIMGQAAKARGPRERLVGRRQRHGRLRHRLPAARLRHGRRARRQPAAGRRLPDRRGRRRGPAARRVEAVRPPLPQGAAAAGPGLLVAHHVRRADVLRPQQAEPLHPRPRATGSASTRTARSTCSSRRTRPGKAREANWLPAPPGRFNLDPADLLAAREAALDPRRLLEAAGQSRRPRSRSRSPRPPRPAGRPHARSPPPRRAVRQADPRRRPHDPHRPRRRAVTHPGRLRHPQDRHRVRRGGRLQEVPELLVPHHAAGARGGARHPRPPGPRADPLPRAARAPQARLRPGPRGRPPRLLRRHARLGGGPDRHRPVRLRLRRRLRLPRGWRGHGLDRAGGRR